MTPAEDLATIIAIAKSHASHGKPPKYIPALELAYARTITYLAENWQPKQQDRVIKLTPSDAETRIRP